MGNYGAWHIEKINNGNGIARLNSKNKIVHLKKSDGILYEGIWGNMSDKKTTCITGLCLMGGNWLVEFKKSGQGNPPAIRSLASIKDRRDIEKRLKIGKKISKIFFPISPGEYHKKLLFWIIKKAAEHGAKRILFHLPVEEYLCFIKNFEHICGITSYKIRELFEEFVQQILFLITEALNYYSVDIEFIKPMKMGAKNEMESFGYPYFFPEKFNVNPENLFGIEDLCEIKISICAQETIGHEIPVYAGVISLPHPYLEKSISNCEEIIL